MESRSDTMPSSSILLVEDDKATLKLFAIILTKRFPYVALYTANNGRTGLELFKTHRPDIVITDINMPEMGGEQMADKIRAIKPDTKFIVITGRSRKPALQDSDEKEFEIDHFIVKPVVFEDLFEAIEQSLGEITQHRSSPLRSVV